MLHVLSLLVQQRSNLILVCRYFADFCMLCLYFLWDTWLCSTSVDLLSSKVKDLLQPSEVWKRIRLLSETLISLSESPHWAVEPEGEILFCSLSSEPGENREHSNKQTCSSGWGWENRNCVLVRGQKIGFISK